MNDMNPAKLIEKTMEEAGVSREAVIQMMLTSFEAALRADGPDEKSIQRKLGELFLKAGKARAPWLGEFAISGYRKNLPGWIKLNDEALERGQDPVTVMSFKEEVSMSRAKERIEIVRAHKEGKTLDQLLELSYQQDEAKTDEELYAEMLVDFAKFSI
ncbi:hypothetical protein SEA_SATIS_94 [Streptomyces phage Satis]|nr:hypothetical protein SEA_SATIS_94 [Streptomyces phage Satis]QBZ71992.1 hypothetical protein SEA_KRADAL_94 [Streptomyces phage Kradal]QPL14411.1 hypothetical protein SEA_EHYELIMAYOE_94 [Streptomyces phage EhyElimayoE]